MDWKLSGRRTGLPDDLLELATGSLEQAFLSGQHAATPAATRTAAFLRPDLRGIPLRPARGRTGAWTGSSERRPSREW